MATAGTSDPFDLASLEPFTSGKPYIGGYETGLYPAGKHEMPAHHRRAGERVAAAISPLDTAGQPDDNGRTLALVMGHSNCRDYFRALREQLRQKVDELHPRFLLLNAAVGGQQLPEIRQLRGPVWDRASTLLSQPGHSPQQVQVLFLHTTYHPAQGDGRPPRPFPETMRQMQRDLAVVLAHCVETFPNLKIAYLTCDGLRHYTGLEPHVWQEAFALKWLIAAQIRGEKGTAFEDTEGQPRILPWLSWGPYIWDKTWDANHFTDGVHPAANARAIFVCKYWAHLKADSVAQPWMFDPRRSKPPPL